MADDVCYLHESVLHGKSGDFRSWSASVEAKLEINKGPANDLYL